MCDTEIIVSLITGGLAFAGVLVSNLAAGRRIQQSMEIKQAVTAERLSELTREVREHNNFAQRVPVIEAAVEGLSSRVAGLERS